MTTTAWCKELGGKLVPADEASQTLLSKIKTGSVVQVEVKRPRNIQHHRKFWALANIVYNNQEHYPSVDALVAALKTAVGHCELIDGKGGVKVALPKSIAFHAMSQDQFEDFYTKCLDVVAQYFLPNVDTDALRAEVEGFLR